MRRIALLVALLVSSCASAPTPLAAPPAWTSMPPLILEALCAKLQGAALSSLADVAIVSTTQPLANGGSLRSVAHLYNKDGEVGAVAQAINAATPSIPVNPTSSAGCNWRLIDKIDPVREVDVVTIELSSPFVNPFQPSEAGLLGRISVGGHDAQWYWIPLAERNGRWAVGTILPTDMHAQ